MGIIRVDSVSKIYYQGRMSFKALDRVSLEVDAGEFVALAGPSGSGKTTLLNLIGSLDIPDEGEVYFNQKNLSELSDSQRADLRLHQIGFVFQAYNLIPVLTARENVEFIMHLQGRSKSERDTRTKELLKAVGLADRINSRPNKLSGGQQQRIAVARALASKPKFILADEPTANLDTKSTENLLDIMERLNKEEDITFIFSTHDARVVKKARRVVTMEDGKIVSDIVH